MIRRFRHEYEIVLADSVIDDYSSFSVLCCEVRNVQVPDNGQETLPCFYAAG